MTKLSILQVDGDKRLFVKSKGVASVLIFFLD